MKVFVKSKLPNTELAKIWRLADYNKDGRLCDEEFALAMHLIDIRSHGHELPETLPKHLVPPSQRGFCSDLICIFFIFRREVFLGLITGFVHVRLNRFIWQNVRFCLNA